MNKRIRELMAEAVTFRLDPDSNAHEAQVCPEDLELFAELIIGECIHKINDIAESSSNPQPIYRVTVDLLEHFGVRE